MAFATIDDIKTANAAIGHHWFSADTVDHHGSKVESGVISGRYFIESGYANAGESDSPRRYRICQADDTGQVSYAVGGEIFGSAADASSYAEQL